jgi:hypothetical protein
VTKCPVQLHHPCDSQFNNCRDILDFVRLKTGMSYMMCANLTFLLLSPPTTFWNSAMWLI